MHDAIRFRRIQDGLDTGRAEVARHCRYDGGFTLVSVGQVAGVVDQFSRAANRTFHALAS